MSNVRLEDDVFVVLRINSFLERISNGKKYARLTFTWFHLSEVLDASPSTDLSVSSSMSSFSILAKFSRCSFQ